MRCSCWRLYFRYWNDERTLERTKLGLNKKYVALSTRTASKLFFRRQRYKIQFLRLFCVEILSIPAVALVGPSETSSWEDITPNCLIGADNFYHCILNEYLQHIPDEFGSVGAICSLSFIKLISAGSVQSTLPSGPVASLTSPGR